MSIDQILRSELTPDQYTAAVDPVREVLCLVWNEQGATVTSTPSNRRPTLGKPLMMNCWISLRFQRKTRISEICLFTFKTVFRRISILISL